MTLRFRIPRGWISLRRWATGALVVVLAAACAAEPEPDRVLILVVDGLRPDYVTAETMPRLNALAESGVRGLAHHAVFPTVTRVNGPAIFTGRLPGGHGLLGNSVYLPEVDSTRTLNMSSAADLRRIDESTGGALLTAPSLGEMLAEQGLTFFAASSGSTGSGTLMNHRGAGAGLIHHELTIPDTLGPIAAELLGPVPEITAGASSVPLVARAIDALLLIGVDRADADVVAAWLTEPDGTAHLRGIGAPETVAVLADVDAEIGRLLDGLAARGLLERTNVLVTSDHGFSTQTGSTSLTGLLVDAGLKESARSTDVVVAGDAIHVRSGGQERVGAIVSLLQRTDWVGPVFTRASGADPEQGTVPGTLSFGVIGWDHERSADILMSPAWTDAENEHGYRGEVLIPGVAGHGSASPWDIRSTFIAAGPAIKAGVTSDIPTGNVDITPTALRLVGAAVPEGLDGRVLEEILVGGPQPASLAGDADFVQASTEVEGVRYEVTAYRLGIRTSSYFSGTDVTRTRAEALRAVPTQAMPVVVTQSDIGDGFYGRQRPFAETTSWLGLYGQGEATELRPASIGWTTAPDDDDPGAAYYDMEVTPPGPLLLFGDVEALSPGAATVVASLPFSLGAGGSERDLALGAARYVVHLDDADTLGCDARITLSDGVRSQVLYRGEPDACDEPHHEVVWAGDLDGDGILDLVTTFSPKYSVYPRRLWLSSLAGPDRLVAEAAAYERTAM